MARKGDAPLLVDAKFAAVYVSVYILFNSECSLVSKPDFILNRAASGAEWRGLCVE